MEYIKQPELKYLRALGCAYLRITARPSGLSDLGLGRFGVRFPGSQASCRVVGFRDVLLLALCCVGCRVAAHDFYVRRLGFIANVCATGPTDMLNLEPSPSHAYANQIVMFTTASAKTFAPLELHCKYNQPFHKPPLKMLSPKPPIFPSLHTSKFCCLQLQTPKLMNPKP